MVVRKEKPSKRRIAVVDDEPFICEIVERALSRRYEVCTYRDAQSFLGALEEGIRFDVIFCDLMMPGTTGREIYDIVEERWPEQVEAMVFMSGVASTAAKAGPLQGVKNVLIEKPFQLRELRDIAEEMLNGNGHPEVPRPRVE